MEEAKGSSRDSYLARLDAARARAVSVAASSAFSDFVDVVRKESAWRFKGAKGVELRYLRNVDHHLRNFAPRLLTSLDGTVRTVFDFGCGSGSGSIALAMLFPEIRCIGTDIDPAEVAIGRARAKLYGVDDRCQFDCIAEGHPLPAADDQFDLCICCSVLEYVTGSARKFHVQEMARIVAPGGLLFVSVPNRLYPFEIHSRKLGWNWFPKMLKARIVGSDAWQVKRLARPAVLKLHRTPWSQLLRPWTNFGLKKVG